MSVRLGLRHLRSLLMQKAAFHVTPKRLAYWALSRTSFLLASRRDLGLPRNLWIEATNACNLHCQICPTGSGTLGRPTARLSFARFKQVVDELSGSLIHVMFSGYGEPLLNPEIYDMVAYAHDRKIFTEIYSNLLLPDDAALRKLIESGLDLIVVAIDLAPQGQNWRYTRTTAEDIARVKDRLLRLAELKKEYGSKLPVVRVSYPVTRDNASLLDQAAQLAQEVAAEEFVPKTVNTIIAGKSPQEMKDKYVAEGFDRYSRAKIGSGRCRWPYAGLLIYANGEVTPCCYLGRNQHIMGNAFEEGGVRAIWNNEKYCEFRYRLMHDPSSVPYCAQCVERFETV